MADLELARHQHAYERLAALYHKGKLPHALLLTGLAGVGKKATAMRLAMAFNCQRSSRGRQSPPGNPSHQALGADDFPTVCGACPPCRQIAAGHFPDIITIDPSGDLIKIGQIRQLLSTLAMKPYGSGMRVVIIRDAPAMNAPAANALLKILEEPPDRTVLILTAVQAESLLPTIRSRCQRVRLAPLPDAYIRERLASELGLSRSDCRVAAALAQGSYSRALEMARPRWLQRRAGLVEHIANLPELALSGKLIWAEMLAGDKAALEDFLNIGQIWLRDLLVARTGGGPLINHDYRELITRQAARFSPAAISRCLESVVATRKAIRRTNPNRRLLAEALVLGWQYV